MISNLYKEIKNRLSGKAVIVGIGNLDLCDDGAGILFVEKIKSNDNLVSLIVGESLEFHLPKIINETPDVIMFVDCTDLGSVPGSAAIIEKDQLEKFWCNTHKPPISAITSYLFEMTDADIFMLGVQPENISFGNNLNQKVADTINLLSDFINNIYDNKQKVTERVLV